MDELESMAAATWFEVWPIPGIRGIVLRCIEGDDAMRDEGPTAKAGSEIDGDDLCLVASAEVETRVGMREIVAIDVSDRTKSAHVLFLFIVFAAFKSKWARTIKPKSSEPSGWGSAHFAKHLAPEGGRSDGGDNRQRDNNKRARTLTVDRLEPRTP